MDELFKPQPLFSCASTRAVFDRLAHSSIMRLNGQSMDKLIDLMTMGFKYQFLGCCQAEDLVDVCRNHMDACREIAEGKKLG